LLLKNKKEKLMREINYMTEKDPYILEKKSRRNILAEDELDEIDNRNRDQEVNRLEDIASDREDDIVLTGDKALDRKTLSLEKLRKKR
jgi:hypothetical protein